MKITKSQLRRIIKEELKEVMAAEGDYDADAPINQPGADPDKNDVEKRAAELDATAVDLGELRDEIARLLEDPDDTDLKDAQNKIAAVDLPEED